MELHRWLPDSLTPVHADGTFVIWFASVPNIPELGVGYTSTECGIVIPVRTAQGGHVGSTFALMLVDNDVAMAGGREIWGYPKKLASVHFQEEGEGNVTAHARHKSYRASSEPAVVSARSMMDGKGEDITTLAASLEPRYLERVIPSPYGSEPQSREVVRVAHRDARIHVEKKCGSAEVVFGETEEGFDRLGRIQVQGAIFRVCDFVLPYAQRVEQGA